MEIVTYLKDFFVRKRILIIKHVISKKFLYNQNWGYLHNEKNYNYFCHHITNGSYERWL